MEEALCFFRPGVFIKEASDFVSRFMFGKNRHGCPAIIKRLETAGVENTAGGRINGAGNLALQDDDFTLIFHVGVGNGHGGK